jgi:hypothetical protein
MFEGVEEKAVTPIAVFFAKIGKTLRHCFVAEGDQLLVDFHFLR